MRAKHTITLKSRPVKQQNATTLFTSKNQVKKNMYMVQKNHLLGFVYVNKILPLAHFVEKMAVDKL